MLKNLEIILCLIFIVFVDKCYFYEPVEHIKIGSCVTKRVIIFLVGKIRSIWDPSFSSYSNSIFKNRDLFSVNDLFGYFFLNARWIVR